MFHSGIYGRNFGNNGHFVAQFLAIANPYDSMNNLVIKTGNRYGLTFFVSALFEYNENVFDEIVDRLKNIKPSYYI